MLTSNVIVRQAYARIGAFQGVAAEIATLYADDAALADANTESFPLQSMYDILTGIENEMGTAVASNEDNQLRAILQDIATVTSGNRVPSTGDGGGKIIGVWGQVRDADSGTELTPGLHQDEIRAIVNGPTGLFKSTLYSYAVRPPRIYATVPDLEIDVCVFNYVTRATAIGANGALLFQQCQNAYFHGLMSNLKNEDPTYTELSNQYVSMYEAWLTAQRPAPSNTSVEASAA